MPCAPLRKGCAAKPLVSCCWSPGAIPGRSISPRPAGWCWRRKPRGFRRCCCAAARMAARAAPRRAGQLPPRPALRCPRAALSPVSAGPPSPRRWSAAASPAEPARADAGSWSGTPMNASCASPSLASLPRLLSLVLPRLPTDRLRRMERRAGLSGAQAEPLVIVGKVRNALVLTAVDAVAERAGLAPGLPLATARAMLPALREVEADPVADAALLDSVADWAERYTPFVGLESLGLEAPGSQTAASRADGLVLD